MNNKLWSLETNIDTMSNDQAESSCAVHSKLVALLRNSTAQDKLITHTTQGNRVHLIGPQWNKRESTPLSRSEASIGAGGAKTIMKGGTSNPTNGPSDSTTSTIIGPDAMTWGNDE